MYVKVLNPFCDAAVAKFIVMLHHRTSIFTDQQFVKLCINLTKHLSPLSLAIQ
jgi:hypothetical protein